MKEVTSLLINTHRMIGKALCDVLYTHSPIGLQPRSFEYGCIKPDIHPKFKNIPHFKDQSFGALLDMLDTLHSGFISNTSRGRRSFSVQLGVALHYITDYFCYAHNHRDSLLDHFKYETKLASAFNSLHLDKLCSRWYDSLLKESYTMDITLEEYISGKHAEYLAHPPGIHTDIKFCLEVCTSVSMMILNRCAIHISSQVA